jgi:hypothetical protein
MLFTCDLRLRPAVSRENAAAPPCNPVFGQHQKRVAKDFAPCNANRDFFEPDKSELLVIVDSVRDFNSDSMYSELSVFGSVVLYLGVYLYL